MFSSVASTKISKADVDDQVFPDLEDRRSFWTQVKTYRAHQTLEAHEKYLASKSAEGPYYYGDKVRALHITIHPDAEPKISAHAP